MFKNESGVFCKNAKKNKQKAFLWKWPGKNSSATRGTFCMSNKRFEKTGFWKTRKKRIKNTVKNNDLDLKNLVKIIGFSKKGGARVAVLVSCQVVLVSCPRESRLRKSHQPLVAGWFKFLFCYFLFPSFPRGRVLSLFPINNNPSLARWTINPTKFWAPTTGALQNVHFDQRKINILRFQATTRPFSMSKIVPFSTGKAIFLILLHWRSLVGPNRCYPTCTIFQKGKSTFCGSAPKWGPVAYRCPLQQGCWTAPKAP